MIGKQCTFHLEKVVIELILCGFGRSVLSSKFLDCHPWNQA